MMDRSAGRRTVVIGAGFTGLSAAYEIASAGLPVTVIDRDGALGGLASGFDVGGQVLERFYHHWFTNDRSILGLITDLGLEDRIIYRPTRTGMYYAHRFFRLSSPLDLLRFDALGPLDRIRLGALVFRARMVRDWREVEHLSAEEWLIRTCGRRVYEVVWQPLLVGKFGRFATEVSAAWFWKKLVLRGGSRSKGGGEVLAYFRGGFAALADELGRRIEQAGGEIRLGQPVTELIVRDGRVAGVRTDAGDVEADTVLATPALPLVADLMQGHVADSYLAGLRSVRYLANICLVLVLDRSLSQIYWLNVNDPGFPFVGVIEHTNFEPVGSYEGRHIVYLSKYLTQDDPLYAMDDDAVLAFALPHLKTMFPDFDPGWITAHHVWRADYAQPIVGRGYSQQIPASETPLGDFFICTMAQIFPEDRGTNYAVREGRRIGRELAARAGSGAAGQ